MKKLFTIVVLTFAFLSQLTAQKSQVFIKNGKAIDGYDVVAFFAIKTSTKGNDSFTFIYNNATWNFATQKNLDSFKANPEKYAPQYGGYCAYGCNNGYKAPTQIETWTIENDKLYFNYNLKVKESWLKNKDALIAKANENWEKIKDKE